MIFYTDFISSSDISLANKVVFKLSEVFNINFKTALIHCRDILLAKKKKNN